LYGRQELEKVRENRHWKIESSITLSRYRDVVMDRKKSEAYLSNVSEVLLSGCSMWRLLLELRLEWTKPL